MLMAIHRFAGRQHSRVITVAAVLALAGAVATAHSVLLDGHMGSDAKACLAVLETVALGLAVVAAAPMPRRLLPRPLLASALPARPVLATPPEPRARAGPAVLQVFRL
jgi:hypothetical protein